MEIIKITLSEQVYNKLRGDIVRGNIPAGSRLVLRDLTIQFGISSSPVRDAMRRLSQEGFVETDSNQGAQVVTLTPKDMDDISALTALHDTYALERSMRSKATRLLLVEDLKKVLEVAQKDMEDVKTEKERHVFWWNHDDFFHQQFYNHADNDRLLKLALNTRGVFSILTYRSSGVTSVDLRFQEHVAMYQAVDEGDLNKAKKLLYQHFNNGILAIQEIIFKDYPLGS